MSTTAAILATYHLATGHPPIACVPDCRICRLIDRDGPHYREPYRRLFHPEEFPDDPAPTPRPDRGPPPDPRTELAAHLAQLLARMRSCPHWVKSSDCGCGANRCAVGKGRDGVVSHADCMTCLDAPPPT